ncbi:MAG: DUF2877 domain-containing protein, partial [Kiritimatiellae bacterium]|nr:DUF2877 domain-containing protein [Kiritimatiellia bacterium]
GASANVVIAQVARKNNYPLTFRRFTCYGFPMMLLTLVISSVYQMLAEPPDPDVPRIREAARSDNLIADSLIECAAEGALCEAHLRLAKAMVRDGNAEVTRCADQVMQAGATSGSDWLTGLCMTLMEDFDVTKERGA